MHGSSTTLDYLKRAKETHRYIQVAGQPSSGSQASAYATVAATA
jgi:hypothetical protein